MPGMFLQRLSRRAATWFECINVFRKVSGMAKQQAFAEKVKKGTEERGSRCPKCNTIRVPILYVQSVRSAHQSYRFSSQRVQVCKCNEKEIYA